ncbi:cyclin-dependent kinase inhibitor 1B-like [Rhinatrema bivittatum]|uniref:cyclin-dependent kinase inhibitor 1B-like n=1 Tax=Rhinatrema bivittatum TaxID=194408 RepID=UPI00112898E3|nr:cyclin-dependent kinase inhibitor 1B-like [Rhinatrema bivittatum]
MGLGPESGMGWDGQERCHDLCEKPCSRRGALMGPRSPKPPPARRNLFGPVDHGRLQRDLQRLLRSSLEAARRKWSFDFARDSPSEGALEWEPLRYQEVPAFYWSPAPAQSPPAGEESGLW